MTSLPETIGRDLLGRLLEERRCAWMRLDREGLVLETGGELEWFGLESIGPGDAPAEGVEALQGSLPPVGEPDLLPRLELVEGRSTDVHAGGGEDAAYLVFLDTTRDARRERALQQRGNELTLMHRALGVAVFEETDGELRLLGLRPPWMRAVLGEASSAELVERLPFVENFLVDARETWTLRGPRIAWSGAFSAEDDRGREWQLEATAARLEDGRRVLVVQSLDHRFEERRSLLQTARARSLDFDRLRREIDKKEALLHYIIHDLKGPLSSMVGSMSLIKSRDLDPERTRELLEVGLEQARHQEAMIRSILDAFAAEIESLQYFESEASRAPDLHAAVAQALETYRSAYEQKGVALQLAVSPDIETPCRVVGEESRLVRVLCNLLENALRVSDAGRSVEISVEPRAGGSRVHVVDQGPGVADELRERLFDRFQRSAPWGGVSGLGLYFCRSTLEMWGGAIGYEPAEGGGARFWFDLARAL